MLSIRNVSKIARNYRNISAISTNSSKDTTMPTPLSLGFDIKYHRCNSDTTNPQTRPLVILAGLYI